MQLFFEWSPISYNCKKVFRKFYVNALWLLNGGYLSLELVEAGSPLSTSQLSYYRLLIVL